MHIRLRNKRIFILKSTAVIVGLSLAAVGFAGKPMDRLKTVEDDVFSGRYLARNSKIIVENLTKTSGILSEGLSVSSLNMMK